MASSCGRLRAFSNLLLSLLLAVAWFLTNEICVVDKKILQQTIFLTGEGTCKSDNISTR